MNRRRIAERAGTLVIFTAMAGLTGCRGAEGTDGPEGGKGAVGAPGENGHDGALGPHGPKGARGHDGLTCWDLNANGRCDTATEDRDGDLDCDATDCRGEIGQPGPPGHGTWVWVDADGTVVPGLVGLNEPGVNQTPKMFYPLYTDGDGFIWRVDTETGVVMPAHGKHSAIFVDPDCVGAGYVGTMTGRYALPRFTFTLGSDDTVRVRTDTSKLVPLQTLSADWGWGCSSSGASGIFGFAISDTEIISPLDAPELSSFEPPFHPERHD